MSPFHHHTHYIYSEETDSTQNEIKRIAPQFEEDSWVVVHTDFQTAGRGQSNNHWEAEKGKNILMSLCCHPLFLSPKRQFLLSKAAALGIVDALSPIVETSIKWPNDIYVEDNKLAGILIECTLSGNKFKNGYIGIGLNVNQTRFHSNAPNPISLRLLTGETYHRLPLLQSIIQHIAIRYQQLAQGDASQISLDYHQHLYRKAGYFPFQLPNGELFEAAIMEVSDDGRLWLNTREGHSISFAFKEIIFQINH